MRIVNLNLMCILLLFSCAKEEPPQPSPPDILVFQTQSQEVPIHREYVGQIYGFKDIAITARVEGYLEGIHFKEGSQVEEGTLLYTVESQPFEADVAAKMSAVAAAKTMLAKAQSDLRRIRPLAEQKAVSESDLDAAVAQYEASVESVKASEAILRVANIQLGYTKIDSPVSGIIGRTMAKVGDFVGRAPSKYGFSYRHHSRSVFHNRDRVFALYASLPCSKRSCRSKCGESRAGSDSGRWLSL